jgi:uncharacterized protein YcbK (DUF882 family)
MLLPLLPVLAALTVDARAPVTVELYDVNHGEAVTITIARDGSVDPPTARVIKHLFRCKRSDRKKMIAKQTLAMFAGVAAHWRGHTIDIHSGYRAIGQLGREPAKSYHRKGRAIDFSIRGVPTTVVRDYLWTTFRHVGVGWYPEHDFLHLDYRPEIHDTAWTFRHDKYKFRPRWAEQIRPPYEDPPRAKPLRHQAGV